LGRITVRGHVEPPLARPCIASIVRANASNTLTTLDNPGRTRTYRHRFVNLSDNSRVTRPPTWRRSVSAGDQAACFGALPVGVLQCPLHTLIYRGPNPSSKAVNFFYTSPIFGRDRGKQRSHINML
jgi:hypothetical protein